MKIEHLRLHHLPATRSARAKWMLHETIGDDFETVIVDLYKGAQHGGWWSVKNNDIPVRHSADMAELAAGSTRSRS